MESEDIQLFSARSVSKQVELSPPGEDWPSLKLGAWILRSCSEMGMKKPTPIQINCIPPILQGWTRTITYIREKCDWKCSHR